jgi:hypothetical protein
MTNESDRLLKIKAKHLKEIDYLDNEGILKNQKTILTSEFRNAKTQNRREYYSNVEKKKDLINRHENVVMLDK